MAFKKDKPTSAITTSPNSNLAKSGSNPGQLAQFKINRESLVAQALPPGGEQIMNEISQVLGVDILDPSCWTKEQIIAANKLAAGFDEKLMMMKGAIRCVVNHGKQSVNNYTNLVADYCH